MRCPETNNILDRLNCKEEEDDMTTGNSAQIAEQTINFHKELHQTTIIWSVGAMVVLVVLLWICRVGMKICGIAWRQLTGGPVSIAGAAGHGAQAFVNGGQPNNKNPNNSA